MNSDPHESAAWRTFGMLDTDKAAGFDESMRHDRELKQAYLEMESITAAIAIASVQPVTPRAGQLHRLERQLGIHSGRRTNWAAISGWAAAAAVTLLLVLNREAPQAMNAPVVSAPLPPITRPSATQATPEQETTALDAPHFTEQPAFTESTSEEQSESREEEIAKIFTRQETRRLVQEIEVLKDRLHDLQQLDRERFDAVPGTAWPIVMRMSPPGVPAEPTNISFGHEETPITAILGDALASVGDPSGDEGVGKSGVITDVGISKGGLLEQPIPSAVPIYDAARDTGTLVVNNLPATMDDESYNLWVKTDADGKPIYVGRLPRSNARAADSFDFSLGSMGIVPSGFLLTRDPRGKPSQPTAGNIVLQGP